MTSKQKQIYIELLENRVDDLEQQVKEMKQELLFVTNLLANQRIPTLEPLTAPFQSETIHY